MVKSESFRKSGRILNYLVYKSKKIIPLDKYLEFSYLTFIEEIFQDDTYKDTIEDIDKELMHAFKEFSFVNNYHALPISYKLRLLMIFIYLLLDTKLFNDECNKRLEEQLNLSRESNEILSTIKNKKNIENKNELETRLEEIKTEMKSLQIRTLRIGYNRNYKEYLFFPWDISKLYIKTPDLKNKETFKWTCYIKKQEIEEFILGLCDKGIRESHLREELKGLLENNEFLPPEVESTSSETDDDKKHTENINTLLTVKNWLKNLHISIAETLQISACLSYLESIDSSDLLSIPSLIINFHQAFTVRDCSEEPYKVTKKVIGLWDYCELHSLWENSLGDCTNISEIFLCMHLLAHFVEKFNKVNKVIEVTESAYMVARRSYRLERLTKLKKEVYKEQDTACYLCGECGLVACCDTCPKVAHLECMNIETLPDGEWNCPLCVEKFNNIRVTRSKQIKY